jgi:NAD(P)-dependent dehydrogenase (short-subunit alcohol dehydrogenase family)
MTVPSFRLDRQTALVTGAASGIGRAIAVGIAESGADVACFDLPGPGLDEVCAQIRAAGVPCR